jgi:hypothetical protein
MENKELKESYIDERTGIEYRLVGDYYLPDITLPKPRRTGNIGKYGRLRLKYLKEHCKPKVMLMRINNELTSHLLDIEDECELRVGQLIKEIAEKENITEELKANNQVVWVQSMNNIKNRAEEIAYSEIIYK